MKKYYKNIFYSSFGLLSIICLFIGVSNHKEIIVEIRELYKATNQRIKENKAKIFYLTKVDTNWNITNSLFYLSSDEISLETVEVFIVDSNIIKTVIEIQSPSGDWINTSEYYFFPSGNTAFVFQKHVTFQGYNYENQEELPPGPYVIEKRIYFNQKGEIIRNLKKTFLASNHSSIKNEYVKDIQFEFYKSNNALPFAELLKRKSLAKDKL